jgi:hypothetical protein
MGPYAEVDYDHEIKLLAKKLRKYAHFSPLLMFVKLVLPITLFWIFQIIFKEFF